jgi:hypothetical protein
MLERYYESGSILLIEMCENSDMSSRTKSIDYLKSMQI